MKKKNIQTTSDIPKNALFYTVVFMLIALGFLTYSVWITRGQTATTVSKAAKPNFLTPADDVFSLEEDLERLKSDPGEEKMKDLEYFEK